MASITAIAATTDAATSSLISLSAGQSIQVHASHLLGRHERVLVDQSADDGVNWQEVVDKDAKDVLLTFRVTRSSLTGPGSFRLRKTETDSAVAVYYDQ